MAHNIQLDVLEPLQENSENSVRLFRNAMLTKLAFYVNAQPSSPSWLLALRDDQWRGITINPSLVYLLTRKPLVFSWEELRAAIDKYREPIHVPQLFTTIDPDMLHYYLTSCNEEQGNIDISPWKKSPDAISENITRALDALETAWPPAHLLVRSFIKEIFLVDSPHLLSATLPRFHGAILLGPKNDNGIAHYIEALVHEASHLELNVRRMVEPFLLNPHDVAHSALRREMRPLLGIMHAAFVLCRTTEALQRASSLPLLHDECRVLYERFVPILHDTIESLGAAARFTVVGEQFYALMREKAQRMFL